MAARAPRPGGLGLGAVERAREVLEEALATVRQNADPHSLTPLILESLGKLEIVCNRANKARECLVSSLVLRNDSGEHSSWPYRLTASRVWKRGRILSAR